MDLASRITVTCFAASYAVAFLAELARLFWPAKVCAGFPPSG